MIKQNRFFKIPNYCHVENKKKYYNITDRVPSLGNFLFTSSDVLYLYCRNSIKLIFKKKNQKKIFVAN